MCFSVIAETTSVEGLSPGLSILKGTRHVFIQRAGTEFVDSMNT